MSGGVVVPGPGFGGPRVGQVADGPGWWYREGGRLVVWCSGAWWPAPVPMVEISEDELRALDVELARGGRPDPGRITAALDLRGLDGPEVDEALGVADAFDTVVDSWEAGEVVPTMEELRRLGFLTGFGPGWFFRGPMPALGPVFVCGRGVRR